MYDEFINIHPQEVFSGSGSYRHCQGIIEPKNTSEGIQNKCEDACSRAPVANASYNDAEKANTGYKAVRRGLRGEVDTSNFSIEERLISAVWVHERKRLHVSIGQIKRDFRQRFDKEPPTKNTLLIWEKKLFATGNVMDAKRSGRPCQRKEHVQAVEASLRQWPALSLRARAAQLRLPRTTLRTILRRDLRATLPSIPPVPSMGKKPRNAPDTQKQIKLPSVNKPTQPESFPPPPQNVNPVNYHNYGEVAPPGHLAEYHPFVDYQNRAPHDSKTQFHQTQMVNQGQIDHQHYLVGSVQGNVLL